MAAKLINFPGATRPSVDLTPDAVLRDLIGTGLTEVVVVARGAGGLLITTSCIETEQARDLLHEGWLDLADVDPPVEGPETL